MTYVGWSNISDRAGLIFPPPEPYALAKDLADNGKSFLSCPAVRSMFQDTFVVKSPFSIKLRAASESGFISIAPVYPFTSVSEKTLKRILKIHARDVWRKPHLVTLQITQPYIFFSDEPITMEQIHPQFGATERINWMLIPAKGDQLWN